MKKRGISPLIATVIIVGFVILASILIYNWGLDFLKGEIEDENQNTELTKRNVGLETHGFGYDCNVPTNLCVFIVNEGNVNVERVDVLVDFDGGQQILSKEITILPYRQGWVHLDGLDCSYGTITSVEVVPSIIIDGELTPVSYASDITSSVQTCGEEMEDPEEVNEVCDNEVDDDGDTLVDCNDPDCFTDPACDIPFVWEEGRPSCEFNCLDAITEINSEEPSLYGHNDFAFFKDHNDIFHIIAIKSIKCTAEPTCNCGGSGYCQPFDELTENNFVHYTSTDLINWNREVDVLNKGSPGDPDGTSIWAPHVVEKDGIYYMYYAGVNIESCPGGPNCVVQRIMLATNDGTDLNNPDNWIKQGVVFECSADWSEWDSCPDEWSRSCRDPMVYEISEDNYIMYYMSVPLTGGSQVIGYATSNNLIDWAAGEYIPDTAGSLAEGPFLFKKSDDDKYYLHYVGGNTLRADGVILYDTPITGITLNFNYPSEFIYVNNEELGINYLIKARVYTSTTRDIEFDIYGFDGSGNMLLSYGEAYCPGCDPQPNMLGSVEVCEYNQDCQIDLGCVDYSGFLDYEGNPLSQTFQNDICCDIGAPSGPEDSCCANAYDGTNGFGNIYSGAAECWEICGGTNVYETGYPNFSGEGYCDSTGHCRCDHWACTYNPTPPDYPCEGFPFE